MKIIQLISFLLLTIGTSTISYAQKTSKPVKNSGNVLSVTDKEADRKIKEIEANIKKTDEAISIQEKKRGQRYRDVSIDVQYEMNMREDSIYLSLCSEKTALQLKARDLKQESLRKLTEKLSQYDKNTNAPEKQ